MSSSRAANLGTAISTVIMYTAKVVDLNTGVAAWASVNFLQLAKISVLIKDSNDTTGLFLSESGSFVTLSFSATMDLAEQILGKSNNEDIEPS